MHLGNRGNVVIHDKKIIFMMLKKCASVTMGKTILDILGHTDFSGENINKTLVKTGYVGIAEAATLDYTKVAWVRNPFDRLVSGWLHRVKKVDEQSVKEWYGISNKISFPDFINWVCSIDDANMNAHFRQQTFDLVQNGELVPNAIMKLESLGDDWKRLQAKLNWLPDLRFHSHKQKDKGNWKDYYTDNLLAKVSERFKDDFSLLGF